MLEKTSVSIMVLLLAASLIGIAGIHQYVEGQTPPPAATPKPQQPVQNAKSVEGKQVLYVIISESSAGKTCNALVRLPGEEPNNLRLPPGTIINLLAPSESFCTLFGLSKIGNTQILFDAQKIAPSSASSAYRATRVSL